jgi:hypothetical protein
LVSDRYVVTAAHCTNGQSPSGLKVYVGGTSLATMNESTSFIINVKSIKQHPNYDSSNIANDISILELESAVDLYSFPTIKPICLPAQGATFPNEQATVSGWGTLASGGSSPSTLHEVDVTVFADGNCGEMNQYMTPDMLCAGLMEGGKDACQGDSGGPLFLSDPANNNAKTLIGAVSWGFGCANPGQLGIYAEVSYFRDWIDSQIPDMNTCGPSTSTPEPWTCESSSGGGSGSGTTMSSESPITTTGSGNSSCGNCVFPFTFMEVEHMGCTTIDGDQNPWCSTLVDENGEHVTGGGHWEYCGSECPTVAPPTTTTPPPTTTTTPTTTSAPEECADKDTIPVLRVIEKLKKVKTVLDCSKKCIANPDCDYYKWKTHKKANKRQCHLMQIQYIPKRNWWSGPRNC